MGSPAPAPDPRIAFRIAEAERAHGRGWLQTPIRGKAPYLPGWQGLPPPTVGMACAWAGDRNVGIRTGSASGIVVIDDDTSDGSAAATLDLPPTVTALTGGGHKQYYFKAPAEHIGNSESKLGEKIDVKGENGVVAAVGSIHPVTDKQYVWAPEHGPDEISFAPFPPQLIEQLAKPKSKSKRNTERYAPGAPASQSIRSYASLVLRGHAERLAAVPEGARNSRLNSSAFVLGRIVGAGALDRADAESSLHTAAAAAGLTEQEIVATIRSGIETGIADPQSLKVLERKARRAAESGADIPVVPRADDRERPVIIVEGGKLPEIVDAAERALLNDGGPQIYQRETLLVRMTRSSSVQLGDGIRRPEGSLMLILIEPAYMLERLTRAASFQRYDERQGAYKVIDCTERIAATYLARRGYWKAPALRAVIEAPTLRPDGSVLQAEGYDKATQLFLDTGGIKFDPVPESPTKDDALAALATLHDLLKGFPFLEKCDRSVAIAAILTGLVRRSLRTAPLFAFRAPKMGSGKSLLADVVALFATGRPAPAMPQGKDEDEDRKRMLAILIEGEAVSCIDNVERPLSSSALCSILTQVTYKDRVLGKTGTATVPTCTTWVATGNNMQIAGDLSTRCLVCDLDAKLEHPEEREFQVNLYEFIPDHRDVLVPAALTILRAYHLARRPRQAIRVFGRFESWSNWIRSALVWCGEKDPCETRKRIEAVDPVRHQLRTVLALWMELIGTEPQTAAQVIASAQSQGEGFRNLNQALLDAVACTKDDLNALRLGNWIAKHERRIEAGLRFERACEKQNTVLWRITRVGP